MGTALTVALPIRGGAATATVPIRHTQCEGQLISRNAAIPAARLALGAAVFWRGGCVTATGTFAVALACGTWLPGNEAAAEGERVCVHAGTRAAALAFGAAARGDGRKRLTAARFFAHSQIAHAAGLSVCCAGGLPLLTAGSAHTVLVSDQRVIKARQGSIALSTAAALVPLVAARDTHAVSVEGVGAAGQVGAVAGKVWAALLPRVAAVWRAVVNAGFGGLVA